MSNFRLRNVLFVVSFLLSGLVVSFNVQAAGPYNGVSGDCTWEIDSNGNMVIKPTSGTECTLANSTSANHMSYNAYRADIVTIKFEGKVYTNTGAVRLFSNMTNLVSIDFTGFDTSKATNMNNMFDGSTAITSLDLPNFDTSNVVSMNSMFNNCKMLRSLNLSSFNTAKAAVANGGKNMNAFLNATPELREISLGDNTNLGSNVIGRGLWRNLGDGKTYGGAEINRGPGTFVKISNFSDDMNIPYAVTYRIDSVAKIDEFTTTRPDIFTMVDNAGPDRKIVATIPFSNADEYSIPGEFGVLFKGVVRDQYNNAYDLEMTFENIKLYDLDSVSYSGTFSTAIFYLTSGYDAIRLSGDSSLTSGNNNVSRSYDITFKVLKNGTPVEGSYLFSAYDLDGTSARDGGGWGNFSEGVNFGQGFDLSTIILSQYTTLQKIGGNRYTGTQSESGTERSELVIKADAREAKFTWTTGGNNQTELFMYYQPMNIEIAKKDQYGGFVAGATLEISVGGQVIKTWQSEDKPSLIWLNPGVYKLKEIAAPDGYEKTNEEIEFIVDDSGLIFQDKPASQLVVINNKLNASVGVPNTGVNSDETLGSEVSMVGCVVTGVLIALLMAPMVLKRVSARTKRV